MSATTTRALLLAAVLAGCAGPPDQGLGDPLRMDGASGPPALWMRDLGRAIEHPPVVAQGTILVATTDARLFRLSAGDGVERWKSKLASSPTESPLLCGSTVVVGTDAPRCLLQGFDLERGRLLWEEPFAFPALPCALDTVLVAAARGGRVVRLDAATGARRWETRLPGAGWHPPVLRAAEGQVLVPVRPDSLLALDLESGMRLWGKAYGALPWLAAGGEPCAAVTETGLLLLLDPLSGEPLARRDLGGVPAGPPLVHGGALWIALRDGRLLRLALPDLEIAASLRLAPPLLAPPAPAGEGVVQAGPRGELRSFDAGGGAVATCHHAEFLLTAPLVLADRIVAGGAKGTLAAYRREP